MKKLIFLGLLGSILNLNFAQITTEKTQVWVGYLTQTKINNRFSLWNDAHFVPQRFLILRTGLTHHWKEPKITTSLGYAYLWLFPTSSNLPTRHEHRPWGQTTLSHSISSFNIFHRLRYEARFRQKIVDAELLDEFNFNWRLRYLLQSKYFINQQKKDFYIYASDELLFDQGNEIMNDFRLNQNRASLGFGYQLKNMTFQVGYMNILQPAPKTSELSVFHTFQLLVFHNFNLKTNKK